MLQGFKTVGRKAERLFDKATDSADKLFNKGTVGGTTLFGKGSVASRALHSVSKGLNTAGNIAHNTGDQINKILNNDKVQTFLGASPLGATANTVGRGLALGLNGIANASHLGSELAKQRNYRGGAGKVIGNVLERAKQTGDAVKKIQFE